MSTTEEEKERRRTTAGSVSDEEKEESKEHTKVDLSAYVEPHSDDPDVKTFAIEEHQRNTADNPAREATNIVPVLVRRIDSQEILPRPFKSMKQLLCTSYLCLLCCCFCAAFAVERAFEAKEKRNAGIYTSAIDYAKSSRCCMIAALVSGLLILIITLAYYAGSGGFDFDW